MHAVFLTPPGEFRNLLHCRFPMRKNVLDGFLFQTELGAKGSEGCVPRHDGFAGGGSKFFAVRFFQNTEHPIKRFEPGAVNIGLGGIGRGKRVGNAFGHEARPRGCQPGMRFVGTAETFCSLQPLVTDACGRRRFLRPRFHTVAGRHEKRRCFERLKRF